MREIDNTMNQRLEKLVEEQLFEIFSVLRGERITSEQYHIVLLLLSLYKDGVITWDTLSNRLAIKDRIIDSIRNLDSNGREEYSLLYESYSFAFNQLSTDGLSHLLNIMLRIEHEYLCDYFSKIFDLVLYKIAKYQGKYKGESLQPAELTELVYSLAELPPNANVYNPFAGLASFGVYLGERQNYFGQEIMTETWAIGALRMKAYNLSFRHQYVCENSLTEWPESGAKFDLIVSHPPLGLKIGRGFENIQSDARTVEEFLIKEGIKSLREEGKLMAIVTPGFLFRGGGEGRLREQLIKDDVIDTIISLPGGLLYNTGIPIVLLVLNKKKDRPGIVRFVQAENFLTSENSQDKILDVQRLLLMLGSDNVDSEAIRLVDSQRIANFRYNLSVPRYFQKEVYGVKLSEISTYLRGGRSEFPNSSKLIKIKHLTGSALGFKLDLSQVEERSELAKGTKLIDKSCLLIAARGKWLKPTFFKYSQDSILITNEILPLIVDENVVDVAYLINELEADYVQEQLDSFRIGVSIPMIRREDLMEVVVKLPPLQEQKAKMQGILEVSKKIELLQKKRNARAHGKASSDFNEFASLKHTLGRPRQNILDWSDNLHHFLSTKPEGFEKLNKEFLAFYDTDILSALKEINRDVNFMTKVLEKGENGFQVEDYEKNLISLAEVNSMLADLSENGLKFKIKRQKAKGEDLKTRGIYGSKVLLQTLFDNLLTNANKYGFETKKQGNEVVIELKVIDDFLSIEVRNNGKPFPKKYDRESFITKYSTADSNTGTGLGGYDIHRIAKEFENPDWRLVLNEDPIYPVKFQFQISIKLVK